MSIHPVLYFLIGAGFLFWAARFDFGPTIINDTVRLTLPFLGSCALTALQCDEVFELFELAFLIYFITWQDEKFDSHFRNRRRC